MQLRRQGPITGGHDLMGWPWPNTSFTVCFIPGSGRTDHIIQKVPPVQALVLRHSVVYAYHTIKKYRVE